MLSIDTYLKSIQKNLERGSERTHYPALKDLLETSDSEIEAIIEEKGNKAGIPDFTVKRRGLLVGYVEAKDVGLDLDKEEKTEQLQRYQEAFSNWVLTNFLEFRWYVDGKCRLKETLAERRGKKLEAKDIDKVATLLEQFFNYAGEVVRNPEELAGQMARLTKVIRLATATALEEEGKDGELRQLKQGFSEVLLPDIADGEFADMYAQTISYGLFAARVGHTQVGGGDRFSRRTAGSFIPATNPFLRRLFNTVVETDAVGKIDWAVDDLVQLLSQVDMTGILENFGRRTRQEDPVVHFYETFLAAYNAALRKSRGVYYTPEPVVSFIVRSVDGILKERFGLSMGLADNTRDSTTGKPRVQILDPATGTGTFLYEVVKQIYGNLEEMGLASQWDSYVEEHLLGRLFGFELLMAPYAIAHLKLGLQLQELGYRFRGKQRLGVYLTNSLDEAMKRSEVLFGQFVADEANEAAAIKRDVPVMVVLGNPPYSVSSLNTSKRKRPAKKGERYLADVRFSGKDWERIFKTASKDMTVTELTHIGELLERYKGRVRLEGEKNIQPLDDDYIKFIRFAHHQIERTGYGVVGFITNHSYLNGLIHRGMRQELLGSFDTIYVMDLHGNSLLKETAPDGSPDKNVFDIQQGVAILIAVKEKSSGKNGSPAEVFYYDLWGSRRDKYEFLNRLGVESVAWNNLKPVEPNFFFTLENDSKKLEEYKQLLSVARVFRSYSTGFETGCDRQLIEFERDKIEGFIKVLLDANVSNDNIENLYGMKNTSGWPLTRRRLQLIEDGFQEDCLQLISYRPFDNRYTYYNSFLRRAQLENLRHLCQPNLALITSRIIKGETANHCFLTTTPTEKIFLSPKTSNNAFIFPLYLYPDTQNKQGNLFTEKEANFSESFLKTIREKLGYIPTPEAIFYYIYAIFHSPTYRQRYAEFLKIDFPRVPLTANNQLFKALGEKGKELVELHLMKSKKLNKLITNTGGEGDNAVTKITYKPKEGRVYINKTRYFEGIAPEIWEFKIGGYRVLDKWLKDRKKAQRILSFDEVLHYQKVVVALKETRDLMLEIDGIIPGFPIDRFS